MKTHSTGNLKVPPAPQLVTDAWMLYIGFESDPAPHFRARVRATAIASTMNIVTRGLRNKRGNVKHQYAIGNVSLR